MKSKLVLCTLILANIVFSAKCQEINYENFYKNLDSTRITTGLLYNKIVPYTSIQDFTGESDTVVSNSDNWLQLYFELFNSQLVVPITPNISNLCDSIGKDTVNFRVPIGILNMNYNVIKDNALDDSLLVITDSLLYDGPNTSESPYTIKRCFAASALVNNCPTSDITFFLSDDFLFENTDEDILYYQIDFDDGNSPVTMYNNEEYMLSYSQTGEKNLTIKAILSDGDTLRCKSTFLVNDISQISFRSLVTGLIPQTPANLLDTSMVYGVYNGVRYKGTFGIWYGCNNEDNKIKKPVILVEGYDPNNSNEFDEYFGLYNIAMESQLLPTLINQGCDVIILNFERGGALIQANAMVLKTLIQKVDSMKVTNNEFVIVGASMGGLVTRYALSYMEQHQQDHHTRLFISLDSPNQGAYGSLAGQHFLSNLNKIINTPLCLVFYTTALTIWNRVTFMDSDAGKQMLVYHHSAQDGYEAKPHPLRTAFLNEMAAFPKNGYPLKCRNVAISCGSGVGVDQGFNDGAQQLLLNKEYGVLDLYLKINSLPNHRELKILDSDTWLKIPWKFLKLRGIAWVPIPYLTNVKRFVNNNTEPYDNCPGSHYDMIQGLGGTLEKMFDIEEVDYKKNECFIPTISALDLNKDIVKYWFPFPNAKNYLWANIHENLGFDNNGCCELNYPNLTPFDALYVDVDNKTHISGNGINTNISGWINQEINRESLQFTSDIVDNEKKQFEAKSSIMASSPNHNVLICGNSSITYLAGESIILNPGFYVEKGSIFSAIIHKYECTFTAEEGIFKKNSNFFTKSIILPESVPATHSEPSINNVTQDMKGILISPNPAKSYLNLKLDRSDNIQSLISIYNSMGKLVFSEIMYGSSKTIQLNFPYGVYMLKATFDDNHCQSTNFIIDK